MRIEHRAATPADIDALLAAGIPESNLQEIRRVACMHPEAAIRATFCMADFRVSSWAGDKILAVWGATRKSLISQDGVYWLIASEHAAKYPVAFARETKRLLGIFDAQYRHLENHVDAGNAQIIRWLEWLGFTFDPDPVYSATGHLVLRFWR
jgi:hypothetical protein